MICDAQVPVALHLHDVVEGLCTAKAGPWNDPTLNLVNAPSLLEVTQCQVTPGLPYCSKATDPSRGQNAVVARVREVFKGELGSSPPAGCALVTVRIIPSLLPGVNPLDATGLGFGVGSATIEPAGQTLDCVSPSDAGACVIEQDVPIGMPVTVTEMPGSLAGDPASPPDSEFYQFGGACQGSGTCTFTPTAAGSEVDVYFVPATATLTLDASPAAARDSADMFAEGTGAPIAGSYPPGPVYCGAIHATKLPCQLLLRLDNKGFVGASSAKPSQYLLAPDQPFSNNCTPVEGQGPDFCQILMSGDQTVTATYVQPGIG